MILSAIIIEDTYLLLTLYLLSLLAYVLGRLPVRLLVGWYSLPVLFVVTVAVLFVFTEPGTALVAFDLLGKRIALTDNGVLLVVTLLLRALAVVTYSLALFMTTKYADISGMASKVLPEPLANIFLLSYRFNFETSDEMSDIIDAMHSRNGNLARGATRQTRLFAGIFGLAFIHAFERAERIAKAMEARSFSGQFPSVGGIPRPGISGYVLVSLSAAALVLIAYSRYIHNLIGWW